MDLNHHRVEQLLSAYVDGELTQAEARAVEEHLLDCGACRRAYEDLRATKALLGALPVAEPPAGWWSSLRAPLVPSRSRAGRGGRWLPLRGWRPAWALGALLLILALAAAPLVKGTMDRLHATEIGVDLYVREHALQMSAEPLVDRAYLGLVAGDADLVLVGESPRAGERRP
jgi:anti-sigma factor RsiW